MSSPKLIIRTHLFASHSNNYPSFSLYRNIAYRFMPPKSINRAIELYCTHHTPSSVVWTRLFFMWRGITDDELAEFVRDGKGEKEAREKDWKSVVDWKEEEAQPVRHSLTRRTVSCC